MQHQKALFSFMAFLLIFLILSASSCTVLGQQKHSIISLGSSLTPTTNSSWKSPSGLFAFGFFQQGNGYSVGVFVSGISEQTVVWTANQDDPLVTTNATLAFTNDGTLILKQPQVPDRFIINITQAATTASMLDSGNFVLYNFDQKIIWQSFENPTDTILPGQRLSARKELISGGKFRLKMQTDGHLVQYPVGTPDVAEYAYWASGTFGSGDNCSLNLDGDGHLYLLNASNVNIKNLTDGESTKEKKIYMMRIDLDGIFRVYSHILDQKGRWSIMWNSTTDKCDPKGVCGLNAFCVTNDIDANCNCLPGFAFVNPGNWTSGCERNFTAESCKNTGDKIRYEMSPLDNSIWEDTAYSVLQLGTRDECQKACLQDCNCEAALYKDAQCRKQKLPLRYGRSMLSDSSVAFIKVGSSAPVIDRVPTFPTKESKKEQRLDILIIGVSLIGFAFILLAISGFLVYRNQSRRKLPQG